MTDRDRAWDAEHHRAALQIIAEADRGLKVAEQQLKAGRLMDARETSTPSPKETPMSATTTQTLHLLDCPACGKPIELYATYDVRLDQRSDVNAAEKTVTATLMMTGVDHRCPPPELHRGGIVSPALPNPFTRED